jgi:putative hydrolase of the HAD superfamily
LIAKVPTRFERHESYLKGYKAMLFDLDDTLLNRDKAIDKMLLVILDKCYEDIKQSVKNTKC